MKKNIYTGLFMVTLATLMLEILLTRIFSVTMWYHFAFIAISVAMFGMTMGALIVYLRPGFFTEERASHHLCVNSLLFSLFTVICFLTHLCIPFNPDNIEKSIVGIYSLVLTYVIISVPFVFSGICVCLALTKFPRHISKLYAADLAGAALGCVVVIFTLKITDGPTAVIIAAFLASLGSVFFAAGKNSRRLLATALILCCVFGSFSLIHTVLVHKQSPLLRIVWVKGQQERKPLFEKWNSFSRIRVWGKPDKHEKPFGWGFSSVLDSGIKIKQLHMDIDANAYTPITAFNGNLKKLEFLKYDVTNIVHYIKPNSRILVVGSGGGRDILSSLVFSQKLIVGIEINEDILKAVNKRFGDFSGNLDKHPKVVIINDEARSYLARSKSKFDIIQVSLIDTWAATASGAFVLTENSLYTIEAWNTFLNRLSPEGILTFSRWYFQDNPGEVYRITALATASLMRRGIKNPRDHIIIVKRTRKSKKNKPDGIGTILVAIEPFSDKALNTIEKVANDLQFEVVLSPRYAAAPTFSALTDGDKFVEFTKNFPINIEPPTDNNPFFFQMLRFRNMFEREMWDQGEMTFNMKAIYVIGILLVTVIGLTFLCIIFPLILTTKKTTLKGSLPFFLFFMSIGSGFMLIEISQMQRLIIYLGHPIYGLSVLLFALLLSSGIGSYSTKAIKNFGNRVLPLRLLILLCLLFLFGLLTSNILSGSQGFPTLMRIIIAVIIIFPIGFFMGMPFPMGMRLASERTRSLTPWLWGMNGAMAVCASVLAVVIAISSGISAAFWTGFLCYLTAVAAFGWILLKKKLSS